MTSSSRKLLLLTPLLLSGAIALQLRGGSYNKIIPHSNGLQQGGTTTSDSRRAALSTLAGVAALPLAAKAASPDDLVDVYFGVGCFWHVQHEFVEAERKLLNRGDTQLTSLAGYAGGTRKGRIPPRTMSNGAVASETVCYHNFQGVADYGKLGHGEVVGMKIPASKLGAFADVYFDLFDTNGERPDKGDRGPEYRSLLGLPGGVNGPLFSQVSEACQRRKGNMALELVPGVGDDPDTLSAHKVWVMDSVKFPFNQAEVYHQYHDGFMRGEDYPRSYNDLRDRSVEQGRLQGTGCPDMV